MCGMPGAPLVEKAAGTGSESSVCTGQEKLLAVRVYTHGSRLLHLPFKSHFLMSLNPIDVVYRSVAMTMYM